MAGYWPSSFFAFLWTETKSRSIKTPKKKKKKKKKRTRPISSHLDRKTWSIKDLLYGQKVTPNVSFNAQADVSARDFQNQPW